MLSKSYKIPATNDEDSYVVSTIWFGLNPHHSIAVSNSKPQPASSSILTPELVWRGDNRRRDEIAKFTTSKMAVSPTVS